MRRRRLLAVRTLEDRVVPSAAFDRGENGSFGQYQALNGDTAYTVVGSVNSLTDVDYFAFHAEAGETISLNVRAFTLTHNVHSEFDPTVGLFDPNGGLVRAEDGGGVGSIGAAGLAVTATQSGIWRAAVSHHGDTVFDGTVATPPSWDPSQPNSTGPGLHTGKYVLKIDGATRPAIVPKVRGETTFYIDGNDPKMPAATVEVIGVVPPAGAATTYRWQTRVVYIAADYPATAKRGPGRFIPSPKYTTETVQNNPEFTPSFTMAGAEVLRGGRLHLTATVTFGSRTMTVWSPRSGPGRLEILGANPDRETIRAYIDGLATPEAWPQSGPDLPDTHTFGAIIGKMALQESNAQQFEGGVPYWSMDGRRGVGIMQITYPRPTLAAIWDWRRNIDAAVQLLVTEKLPVAHARLATLFGQVNVEAIGVGGVAGLMPAAMIVEQTLRGYNGYDNGAGVRDEFRAQRNPNGSLVLITLSESQISTIWERVPASVRGTTMGDPDYVLNVLGQSDL